MAEFVERLRKTLFEHGTEGDEIMRQMLESVLVLAHSDTERAEAIKQIEYFEHGLVDLMENQAGEGSQQSQRRPSGGTTNDQIDKIRRVKDLRSKLNAKEDDIRIIDERMGLEKARLKTLEDQLSEIPATTTQGRRTNRSPSV